MSRLIPAFFVWYRSNSLNCRMAKTVRIFRFLGVFLMVSGILLLATLFLLSTESTTTTILNLSGLPAEKFDKVLTVLTPRVIMLLRLSPLALVVLGLLSYRFSSSVHLGVHTVWQWGREARQAFTEIPSKYQGVFWMIWSFSLLFNLYNVCNLPIFYDEAWTFLNFTRRGIAVSISHYPAPNNHILHSILTNFTYRWPFSQTINLRIPNLAVTAVSVLVFFYTFCRLLNHRAALVLTSVYAFLFPVLYYGYVSRGYALVLLASIVLFYATLRIAGDKLQTDSKSYVLWALASVVGFYAMPSFLYPVFLSATFITYRLVFVQSRAWMAFLRWAAGAGLAVALLYFPIFAVSGVDAVVGNKYVQSITYGTLLRMMPNHFLETALFLAGSVWVLIPMAIALLYALVKVNRSQSADFARYSLLMPPVILLLHPTMPFPRTWIFLLVPILYLIGVSLQKFLSDPGKGRRLWIIIIGLPLLLIVSFTIEIRRYEAFSIDAHAASKYLLKEGARTVYCNHPLYETNLRYEFENAHKPLHLTYSLQSLEDDSHLLKPYDFAITQTVPPGNSGWSVIERFGPDLYISRRINKN
jgi:hypothetical protein